MITRQFSSTTNVRIGKGLLGVAMSFMLLATWHWYAEAKFLSVSRTAYGQVVWTSKKKEDAEVLFQDLSGTSHKIKPWVRSFSRKYEVGEKIVILFDREHPKEAKFNEPMQIWALTHLFLFLSAMAGIIGILTFKGILLWGPLHQKRILVSS
jgi:accessory colonization factor AcfC